jgi:hypothetical protein
MSGVTGRKALMRNPNKSFIIFIGTFILFLRASQKAKDPKG